MMPSASALDLMSRFAHTKRRMKSLLEQLYRLKVTIVALMVAFIGILLLFLAKAATTDPQLGWLVGWPLGEIGSTFVVTGLIGTVFDYATSTARDRRDDDRLRRLLEDSAPAFKDAVIHGFAVDTDDLRRVATPDLLDSIAVNALSLRLGSRVFAEEVYADIRDQAIRAPERWHDVQVALRLTPAPDSDGSSGAVPRFIVTARWDYTVVPSHATQRFACVSNRGDYLDAIGDVPATIAWFMTPRPGFDAASPEAFELVEYTVDGDSRPIRRSTRKGGQVYTASVGRDAVATGTPVRLSYTYRTITPPTGHRLYIDIEQPTKGISVELDYGDCDIAEMSVLDLVASSRQTVVRRTPSGVPGRSLAVEFDGWVFPRTGFAFVWTLNDELSTTHDRSASGRKQISDRSSKGHQN